MKDIIKNDDLRAFIQSKIYEIRGQRVMLDFDLAAMYGVETRRLNEQVKRNIERFPEDFMFQLSKGEFDIWKSQIVTSNMVENQEDIYLISQNATSKPVERRGGIQKRPYAFTEFRKMAATLALPNTASDVAQLRKDFEELKLDIEDILRDQNDINESTRAQLEAIDTAIAELQVEHRKQAKHKPIGFVQPKEDEEETK